MEQPNTSLSARAVSIKHRDGAWIVEVINDEERHEREFVLEAHAASYADGQRIRLGIYTP